MLHRAFQVGDHVVVRHAVLGIRKHAFAVVVQPKNKKKIKIAVDNRVVDVESKYVRFIDEKRCSKKFKINDIVRVKRFYSPFLEGAIGRVKSNFLGTKHKITIQDDVNNIDEIPESMLETID